MKIDFVSFLRGLGIKSLAGLSGIQGWLANLILNKLWKALVRAWNTTMKKLEDSKELKKYQDTISQGKDADEQTKVDNQLDLLNPKP